MEGFIPFLCYSVRQKKETTNANTIRKAIKKRAETNDERQADVEKYWVELINALTEDIDVASKFLLYITGGTSRVSEVHDGIAYKTQSRKYIARPSKSIECFLKEIEWHHMPGNLNLAVKTMSLDSQQACSVIALRDIRVYIVSRCPHHPSAILPNPPVAQPDTTPPHTMR